VEAARLRRGGGGTAEAEAYARIQSNTPSAYSDCIGELRSFEDKLGGRTRHLFWLPPLRKESSRLAFPLSTFEVRLVLCEMQASACAVSLRVQCELRRGDGAVCEWPALLAVVRVTAFRPASAERGTADRL
jgi:hypothetical protein